MRTLGPGSIGGVIFDMDGVLFDTENEWFESYVVAAQEFGYSEDAIRNVSMAVIGTTYHDTIASFYAHFGQSYPLTRIEERARALRDVQRARVGFPLKTGVREIVELLREKDTPYAIASSSYHDHILHNLDVAGLSPLFTHVIGGDEVAKGKPDPEIFLKAAARIGVAPERCMVIEDSVNGLRAAHAAGMIPILVPDLVEHPEDSKARAHAVLESLLHVRDYLAEIL